MRLFLDHDVYAITARFLEDLGHDVVTAGTSGYGQTDDSKLLRIARDDGRLLVTRDRDFGRLVFVYHVGSGVIYLRLNPTNLSAVHKELKRVLETYSQSELKKAFVVVETGRHRFRNTAGLE
ncbi:MAG: hypothetical protein F4Z30_14185, partial [Gemmatimonadetes bacterium]|nr:hypothetical protein [Gemmatimonadota bacterium]